MAKSFHATDGTNKKPAQGEYGNFYELAKRLIAVPKKQVEDKETNRVKATRKKS